MATVDQQAAVALAATSDNNDNARPAAILVDPKLLMAARRGNITSEQLKNLLLLKEDDEEAGPASLPPRDPVTVEGDTLLHVVAASGDSRKFLDCATMIVRYKEKKGGPAAARLALEARNSKGDTPLHCAARAGNADMISCLVGLVTGDEAAFLLRLQNDLGETALHHAVRAASKPAIDKLLSLDSELPLACSAESGAGAASCGSPFYLAISLGEMDIASHLFHKTASDCRSNVSYYSGPDGRNVLHAAVLRASVKTLVLLWELVMSGSVVMETAAASDGDLLSQLASQRDKVNGSTPLHLAASLDGLPSSYLLLRPQVRPGITQQLMRRLVERDAASGSAVRRATRRPFLTGSRHWQRLDFISSLVLNANVSMAYQPDKQGGLYPIHVAAGAGGLNAVIILLMRCPDCATLRDAKGRTFLHVAAEEDRWSVVNYVCRQSELRRPPSSGLLLSSILNAQDMNGDTALHRAVHAARVTVVQRLIRNQKVRLDVPNNVGMMPTDVSWSTLPLQAYYAWDFRLMIRRSLLRVGAPYGDNNRGDLFRQKHILPNQDEDKDKKMSQELTAAAQVLALFSVLITTVTFASAFTLPGGIRSAGDRGAGTPVLAAGPRRSYAFDAFILSDALAFALSLFATSLLLYAGVPAAPLDNRFFLINAAYGLMWHSGRSLVAAFALGLYLALFPVARTIAIAVAVFMLILTCMIQKESEGINSIIYIPTVGIGRSRKPSLRNVVSGIIFFVFNNFWSYIIIFGLPAIRNWARLP